MGEQVAAGFPWGISSVGRAPALQAGGHEFESRILRPDWNPGNRWNHSVSGVPSFPLRFPVPSRFPPNASFIGLGFLNRPVSQVSRVRAGIQESL